MASELKRIGYAPENEAEEKPKDTIATFISKVWKIVETADYHKFIHWSENGKTFLVCDYPNFAREVLPLYFKHSNFSSFVRQLNLYGFRKVTHPEQGVLAKTQTDEALEFWNSNFRRGHPELLPLVQRKTHSSHAPSLKSTIKKVPSPSDGNSDSKTTFRKVFEDIHRMQGRQENIVLLLDALKQENLHLHREMKQLKEKSVRQQKVLNKIIQFLVHMVYNGKLPAKRSATQLMLMDPTSLQSPPASKRMRPSAEGLLDMPEVSVLSTELLEPTTPVTVPGLESVADSSEGSSFFPALSLPTTTSPSTKVTTLASSEAPTDAELSRALVPLESLASDSNFFPSITEDLMHEYPIHSAPSSLTSPHPQNRMSIAGVLNHQQNGIDAIPGMVGGQLSMDPLFISEFLNGSENPAANYDYVDTARLFESLNNLGQDTITDENTLYHQLQNGTLPQTSGVTEQDADDLEKLLADS